MTPADAARAALPSSRRDDRLLLTVKEACDLLQLSKPTVYALIHAGELRSLAVGRARRIPRQALDEFIAGRLGGDAA